MPLHFIAGRILLGQGGRLLANSRVTQAVKAAGRAFSQFAKKYGNEIGVTAGAITIGEAVLGGGDRGGSSPVNIDIRLPDITLEIPCLPELCKGTSAVAPVTSPQQRPPASELGILPPATDLLERTADLNRDRIGIAADLASRRQERAEVARSSISVDPAQFPFQSDVAGIGDSLHGPEALKTLNSENFQATSDMVNKEKEMIEGLQNTWLGFIDKVTEKNAESKNKLLKVSLAVAKELFTHEKRNAIKTALVNGELAITKVMASVPPPASFVLAGLTAAATAANVAAIMGIAHRGLDFVPGEGTYLLDRGEAVLQPRANVELMDFLSRERRGEVGSSVNINITNNAAVDVAQGDLTTDAEGNSSIELIINTVKSATQSGELDEAFGTNFGLSRANGTVG